MLSIGNERTFWTLAIGLDPKTPDCLRYCSNIAAPGPTVFYRPSDKSETTPLSNERVKFICTEANEALATKTVKEMFL